MRSKPALACISTGHTLPSILSNVTGYPIQGRSTVDDGTLRNSLEIMFSDLWVLSDEEWGMFFFIVNVGRVY